MYAKYAELVGKVCGVWEAKPIFLAGVRVVYPSYFSEVERDFKMIGKIESKGMKIAYLAKEWHINFGSLFKFKRKCKSRKEDRHRTRKA